MLIFMLSLGQLYAIAHGQSVTSQGVYTVESHIVNSLGNNGSGIKVAVIDTGFDVDDAEISSNIAEARSFRSDGDITAGGRTNHGTATAQIVVDVAPGAELYLYNVGSVPNMIRLIDYIMARGDIDIVSLSVAWWGVGPYDGTSELSQKVSEAQDSGILWVSSAGNFADSHWEGTFSDADADGFHNFGTMDETISILAEEGSVVELELTWDDAWGRSANDYELRLYDDNLNLLISSITTQDGDDDPLETIQYLIGSDGVYNIVIERYSGEARNLELFSFGHPLAEHNVSGGSVIIPADAAGSVGVAAVGHDTELLKSYSSRGPTNDGRTKPDIAGPTDVTTSVYDSFGGTSAAAPHVAGVATLIKSANPAYTPDQIRSILEDTTRNHHEKNNEDGTGLANAVNAVVMSDGSAKTMSDLLGIYYARIDLQAAYPEAASGDMAGLVRWAWQYGIVDYPRDPAGPHAVLGPHAHTYALLHVWNQRSDLQAAYPEAASGYMAGLTVWARDWGITDYPADPFGPHAVLGPHAHTYALLSIYDARPDLQAAYPEAASGDMAGLVRWAWQYGIVDYPRDPAGPHAVLGPHAHTYALSIIYDARPDLRAAYPDVVAGDRAALTVWARDWGINDYPDDPVGPAAVLGPHAHTYALLSIYDARPDLQAAYPEAASGDMAGLTVWARDWGINDYPDDPVGPAAVLGPHAHTYALLSIYDARPDLQAAYPEAASGDMAGLTVWARDWGINDYPDDPVGPAAVLGPYAHDYGDD